MKKKNELPGWFPFALVASGLIAIGAGIRSNWGRAQAAAPLPEPSTTPPVQKAGVVQGWPGVYRAT
jgi:hypothetical protein